MSWVAVAVAGAAVVGGYMNSQAAASAADAQTDAANQATAMQGSQYAQQRADQEPWRQVGMNALGQLEGQMPDLNRSFSMSDFQHDPGYQFRMAEGTKAIERSAAARGGFSGSTLKSLSKYGQGVASDEYNNAYNRFNNDRTNRFNKLSSMAGLGQTANQANLQSGMNYANNVNQNINAAGNAQAAGYIGQGNAVNGAIGQGMNTWMNYQYMNQNKPSVPTYGGNSAGGTYDSNTYA